MEFALCNEILPDFSLERQFAVAAELGFAALELAPFTLAATAREVTTTQRAQIRRLAETTGVEVAGLHWLLAQTQGYHLTSPDPEVRRRSVEYLREVVRLGVDLGGRVAVVGSPLQRGLLPGVTYAQAWAWFAEAMAGAAATPGGEQFALCLEPLAPSTQNTFLFTAAEAARLVRQIDLPNVRVILDCFSGVDLEIDFPAAIRAVGPLLGHFHLNDHNGRAPGLGETDFVPIFRALLDLGYEGYASLEVFDHSLDPVEHARRGLAAAREALAAAQGSP